MALTFDAAKALLSLCVRSELNDHAFGDSEVMWLDGNSEVAFGYFSGKGCNVTFAAPHQGASFDGDEARDLASCGTLGGVTRNDTTGPDDFMIGRVSPGLTKEAVLAELTHRPFALALAKPKLED